MSTVFTTNKNLIEPAQGSFNNAWGTAINAGGWSAIDNAFGGNSQVSVTGLSGTVALTIAEYQPPSLFFGGTLSANVTFVLPAGVGGIWTIANGTTGAFTLSFGITGGNAITILPGTTLVNSIGTAVGIADSVASTGAIAAAEAFATAADTVVLSTAESFATNAANTAQANAIATAANASNLSSGTVPNAQLPNPGVGPGVTIAADPGTTPSGAPGAIFYYF